MARPASVLSAAPSRSESDAPVVSSTAPAPADTGQPAGVDATVLVSVHDLVEDVSIDGMCGVY